MLLNQLSDHGRTPLNRPCCVPKSRCRECRSSASNVVSRFDSSKFRILLLPRLWLPLPPSSRSCRCGRPFDVLDHHRTACAEAEVLDRRGYALESAAAKICREAGVGTNIMVRDMDLLPQDHQNGILKWRINTTFVSPLSRDGLPHPRCVKEDGAALAAARNKKEKTYPELTGQVWQSHTRGARWRGGRKMV